jgi:hypothetical protein
MGVDELDRHRPFADGRGATLGRPGPDIAGGEYSSNVRLEQVVDVGCGAREDEAVGVAGRGVVEPLRAREGAEEQEHERKRKAVAASEGDCGEGADALFERAITCVLDDCATGRVVPGAYGRADADEIASRRGS